MHNPQQFEFRRPEACLASAIDNCSQLAMPLDSPFSQRLNTNYVAHPDEETRIRDVIKAQDAIVANLSHEMGEIEEAIVALETRRGETYARLIEHMKFAKYHRLLLSSTLHLPEDLLSEIFSHLVPSPDEWTVQRERATHPIVQISHVCRQWRTAAISTPGLWATLCIVDLPVYEGVDVGDLQEFERRMRLLSDMVSTFISRAAQFPIILRFASDDRKLPVNPTTYVRTIRPLVDLLCQARWAEIDIRMSVFQKSSPFTKLLEIPRHSDDTLRKARFDIVTNSTIIPHGLNFQSARRLTALELALGANAVIHTRMNWSIITELKLLFGLPTSQVPSVLKLCPNLLVCTIHLESHSPLELVRPSRLPPVTLRHLHTFALLGYQPDRYLAQSLILPSLRDLSILDLPYSFEPPDDVAIPEWIRIHGNQVAHMTLSYSRLSLPTLLSCLEGLPNVLSLDFQPLVNISPTTTFAFDRSTLLAMTPTMDEAGGRLVSPCLCPKLDTIAIRRPHFEISAEDWLAFISSRRRQGDPHSAYLKGADIHFMPMSAMRIPADQTVKSKVLLALGEMGVSKDGIMFESGPQTPPHFSLSRKYRSFP